LEDSKILAAKKYELPGRYAIGLHGKDIDDGEGRSLPLDENYCLRQIS
jgi:hypothetical protein